jgi:hypothetical protein
MTTQTYAVQLTANGIASDGTTQPAGTILNFVLWDGVTPYTPHDFAGNSSNCTLVTATGTMAVYQPPFTGTVQATLEQDATFTNGGTITLAAGVGFAQLSGSGTIAAAAIKLPPHPQAGPNSEVQLSSVGTFSITALSVYDGSGTFLETISINAPVVKRVVYTNTGWSLLPN